MIYNVILIFIKLIEVIELSKFKSAFGIDELFLRLLTFVDVILSQVFKNFIIYPF